MAQLHSFYVSNARQEFNYIGKDLSDEAFDRMMQNYTNTLTSDLDMFDEDEEEVEDDNDPFENLIPENSDNENKNKNENENENDSDLLIGNLINLNHVIEENIILEEVDHGEKEFDINDILAKASDSNSYN